MFGRSSARLLATWGIAAVMAVPFPVLAHESTPVAAGCTAGSSGIGDAYYPLLGNSGYDVQHYTLDLDLDVVEGAISAGVATIEAVALLDLCAFNLDFRGLDIDEVSVGGQPAAFSRNGGELTIEPATPLAHGEPFTVEVGYHGQPQIGRASCRERV